MKTLSTTLKFLDLDTNDEGVAIVRLIKDKIGLTLSLKQGSDIEVTLSREDFDRLFTAFHEIKKSLDGG